jgi:hypothetical protein
MVGPGELFIAPLFITCHLWLSEEVLYLYKLCECLCPAHLMYLELSTLVILCKGMKYRALQYVIPLPPVTSYFCEKKNLIISIHNAINLCSSLRPRYQVSRQYKMMGKITVLCISMFSFSSCTFDRKIWPVLGPTQHPVQWIRWALSPGVKRQGSETDHSPSTSTKVRNSGAIRPFPHMSSWRSV